MILFRHVLTGWYHLSPEADALAQGLVLSHAVAMIIWPLGFLLPYFLRASGRAAFTMVVGVSCVWIFRIGLAYVFIKVFHMNVLAVWYAMFVDWIVRGAIYLFTFCRHGSQKQTS